MDPATLAAIIGAVATAGATGASTLQQSLASENSGSRGFEIENATDKTLKLYKASVPEHGIWEDAPASSIAGTESPQSFYEAWKMSGEAPKDVVFPDKEDDLSGPLSVLFRAWVVKQNFSNDVSQAAIRAQNEGVWAAAVYVTEDDVADCDAFGVAFYVGHKAASAWNYSGCYVDTVANIKNIVDGDDAYLSSLINLMYECDNSTSNMKYSTGESQKVSSRNIDVCFTAENVCTFSISSTPVSNNVKTLGAMLRS